MGEPLAVIRRAELLVVDVGLNVAVAPAGRPWTLSATDSAKPDGSTPS